MPTFTVGGREVRIATILNDLGIESRHTIIALDGRTDAASLLDSRLEVAFAPLQGLRGPLAWTRLSSLIRRIRPDLLLTYNWGSIEATLAGVVTGVCSVLHTEDGFGPDEAERPKWRRAQVRRFVLNRAFCTIVPSRTLLNICIETFRLSPSRVRFIPNGIDTARFAPGTVAPARAALGIPSDAFVVGSVGRLRREKDVELLLTAFDAARVPGSWLVVVGDGECLAECRSQVCHLDAGDRVVFVGASQDPRPFYASFDLFAMSSRTEQMPLVLLEAMSFGLPVVCTDVGDCSSMLGAAAPSQIVAERCVSALAARIVKMAKDPPHRSDIGAMNRIRCVEEYSLQSMLSQYRELYKKALCSRSAPGAPQ